MSKIMSVLCSFSFFFSQQSIDSTEQPEAVKHSFDYTKKIEAIYFERAASQLIGFILLNDESLWRWHPDLYSEYFLAEWQAGDQVNLEKKSHHPGLLLTNISRPKLKPVIVSLANETRHHLLSIVGSEDLQGWFLTERIITLSDGSKWAIPLDFNSYLDRWSVGNKMFVSRSSISDGLLVNLDMHWDKGETDARSVDAVFITNESNLVTKP